MRSGVLTAVLFGSLCVAPGMAQEAGLPVRQLLVYGDLPLDSSVIEVSVSGNVRGNDGHPIANAVVELEMNPYYPGPSSTRTWTATDLSGNYQLTGKGHHGAARVRVAAVGHLQDLREMQFIRRDRTLEFNFSLGPQR